MLKLRLTLLLISTSLFAQYQAISPYLNEPARNIGYVDSCAQFWMNTLDESRGGYYTNIDRQGNVIGSWGTNKNLLTQTRNAYGFVRAFMMTGDPIYRDYAEAGLSFMYDHAWDDVYGGWYSQLDENGNVQGATNGRSAFDAHYALLGPAAAHEAFKDPVDMDMLNAGFQYLEGRYWDAREGFEGYHDWITYNGSTAYGKSFNATVDAITTHLLSLYLQTEDQQYLDRMHEICQQIIDHLVGSMPDQAIGFAEEFDADWNIDNGETMTIMGHVLKSAWCLARVYHIDPQEEYLPAAETLMDDVLENGYDHDLGGPYKDYNRITGQMLMWGNPDTAKAWWQMEQAITAGFSLYSITGNEDYLQVADHSLDFFMNHFVDHTYGDVYENRTRYGDETWGTHKGGGGKAAYHSIETGYYAYIYGSLYVQEEAFSLYYWYEPSDSERNFLLNPVMTSFDPIQIVSVELDGTAYSNFEDRTLNLPAGTGGIFKVTFDRGSQTDVAQTTQPDSPRITSAYPNPFNGATQIQISLPQATSLTVNVHDLQGRLVDVLMEAQSVSGDYQLQWEGVDAQGRMVPTGVYLISVGAGADHSTQKVLLLK